MNLLKKYPILLGLLSPFRRSQQKTFIALISALCQAAQANSFAIASELASQTDIQMGSALNRLYRFLRNEGFDNWLLTERLFEFFSQRRVILLVLDATRMARPISSFDCFGVCREAFAGSCRFGSCERKSGAFTKLFGKKHFFVCVSKD